MLKPRVTVRCNYYEFYFFVFRDFDNLLIRSSLTELRAHFELRFANAMGHLGESFFRPFNRGFESLLDLLVIDLPRAGFGKTPENSGNSKT